MKRTLIFLNLFLVNLLIGMDDKTDPEYVEYEFINAASEGNFKYLKKLSTDELIKKAGVEALAYAAVFGRLKTVQVLLTKGVDPNSIFDGISILEHAHMSNTIWDTKPVIKELEKHGAVMIENKKDCVKIKRVLN